MNCMCGCQPSVSSQSDLYQAKSIGTSNERYAVTQQRAMLKQVDAVYPKIVRTLNHQSAQAVERLGNGMSAIPLTYRTSWAEELVAAKLDNAIKSGAVGWALAKYSPHFQKTKGMPSVEVLVAQGLTEEEAQAFLSSPTPIKIEEYLKLTANREAARHAKRISEIAEGFKLEYNYFSSKLANQLLVEFEAFDKVYARMLARTSIVWANNEGAMNRMIDAGFSKKQWYTTADELACPYCNDINGSVAGAREAFVEANGFVEGVPNADGSFVQPLMMPEWPTTHPPLHPNCRCVILAA